MIELSDLSQPYWLIISTVFGLCIGSFLNVLVYRLPLMMQRQWDIEATEAFHLANPPAPKFNLLWPASHCPHCKAPISWAHNIPLLSFILLRRQCKHCKTPISWRYPLVEVGTACLGFLIAHHYPAHPQTICIMLFVYTLLALTLIDLDTYLLPDNITLPLTWLGLLFNLYFQWIPLDIAVLGAITGYLILWIVYQLFKLMTGKEGMGYGDFKLLAAIGAWLGANAIFTIILLASVSGIFFGLIIQKLRGKHHQDPFPFGPCLVFGAYLNLAGVDLSQWLTASIL